MELILSTSHHLFSFVSGYKFSELIGGLYSTWFYWDVEQSFSVYSVSADDFMTALSIEYLALDLLAIDEVSVFFINQFPFIYNLNRQIPT